MNRTNQILAILLVLQLAVAAFIYVRPQEDGTTRTGEALVADFDTDKVEKIEIQDGTSTLTLAKQEAGWVLSEADDFPVNLNSVTSLLSKIKDLQGNDLVTKTESSHNRLKVGAGDYNRLVTLTLDNGSTQRLYIGSSGGANAVHVRVNDESDVYLVRDLSTTDANTSASAWVNTSYLTLDSSQIKHLRLENANGVFEFSTDGTSWTLDDLADGETFSTEALSSLLTTSASIRLSKPLGKTEAAEYGLDAPLATIVITVEEPVEIPEAELTPTPSGLDLPGEPVVTPTPPEVETVTREYTLLIGAKLENSYIAKSSDSEYYVEISSYTGDLFVNKSRADFLAVTEDSAATPSAESDIFGG